MDAVSKTSLLTAAMRAVESKIPEDKGRFFTDPYAELLAGEEGMSLMQRAVAEVGDQPAIAVRTAYLDKEIQFQIDQGVQQIVMLAAGMDTRAYRLRLSNNVTIFELDKKEVFDYKNEKLKEFIPFCHRKCLAVDLRTDWPKVLVENKFKKDVKTLWLVEGLLMYLQESQVHQVFSKISMLAQKGDILLFDILSQALLDAPHMQKQLNFLNSMGAPWLYGCNDPEVLMKNFGWTAELTQPGEFAPHRWPFPVAPRYITNVPRSYFVKATKI